jgi:hypothetical protein
MSVNLLTDYFGIRKNKIPRGFDARFDDESLCRKCGTCCYGSIHYRGRLIIIRELPCKYLAPMDEHSSLCTIYDHRQEHARWCQRVSRESVSNGLFPNDCPYVRGIRGYHGKIYPRPEESAKFYAWLKKIFSGQPRPEYLKETDWQKFLQKLETRL